MAMALARRVALRTRIYSYHRAASTKIGFIGLGNMGLPMAKNLLKAEYPMQVFDVMNEPLEEMRDLGAEIASSSTDAAREADIVITMLPGNKHVETVYHGADGIIESAPSGSLLIDCSTVDPNVSKGIAAAATAKGLKFMDAPVSGGTAGASAGTLAIMCGGSQEDFDLAQDVLNIVGAKIHHCGGPGTGGAAKLANNLLLGITMTGVCEAFALGEKLGIDPKVLAGVINSASGGCWTTNNYHPYPGVQEGAPASRGYEGGFASELMLKDLVLAHDAAKAVGQPLPLGSNAQTMYAMLCAAGNSKKDFSSMMELINKKNEED